MTDRECIEFLQWALPELGLRWPGFRKVRRQVRKRIVRRLGELGLTGISEYRTYLDAHPAEWAVLDALSRISISRFYWDRDVFDHLRDAILPALARGAREQGERRIAVWSAGCASGEEPYTVAIMWAKYLQADFPDVGLRLVATDADEHMLERARRASYPASSLKGTSADWQETAFVRSGGEYMLREDFRGQVEFRQQDIRTAIPAESFHLILCRNLAFTYLAEPLQRQVLERLREHLVPGGFLVIGKHEAIPAQAPRLVPCSSKLGFFRATCVGPASQGVQGQIELRPRLG
jgi:chemotaxis protein methyltransferase CheR